MDQSSLSFASPAALDAHEAFAQTLARQQAFSHARTVLESVVAARRCQQGSEHCDTLRCSYRLALLLVQAGELGNARRLLEAVLRACARQATCDVAAHLAARRALADIFATQGDMAGLSQLNDSQ